MPGEDANDKEDQAMAGVLCNFSFDLNSQNRLWGPFSSQHRCEVLYPFPDVYILMITTRWMSYHPCPYFPGKEIETRNDLMTCPGQRGRIQSQDPVIPKP